MKITMFRKMFLLLILLGLSGCATDRYLMDPPSPPTAEDIREALSFAGGTRQPIPIIIIVSQEELERLGSVGMSTRKLREDGMETEIGGNFNPHDRTIALPAWWSQPVLVHEVAHYLGADECKAYNTQLKYENLHWLSVKSTTYTLKKLNCAIDSDDA